MTSPYSFHASPDGRFLNSPEQDGQLLSQARSKLPIVDAAKTADDKVKMYLRDFISEVARTFAPEAAKPALLNPEPEALSAMHRQVLRQLFVSEVNKRGEWHARLVLDASVFPNCVVDMQGSPQAIAAQLLYADPEMEGRLKAAMADLEFVLKNNTEKTVTVSCEQRPLHTLGILHNS